jgi:hypothetical protein
MAVGLPGWDLLPVRSRYDDAVCPLDPSASWSFHAGVPTVVPLSRRTARAILVSAWGLGERAELVDDAVLVVSELVTNIHRHVGHQPAKIALTWSYKLLSIWAHDRSPAMPRILPEPRQGCSGWDWTGFGLALVQATAERHGGTVSIVRDPDGRGKSVGVDLPLQSAPD